MASISTQLSLPENQIVTVSNATYTGANGVFNASPDTAGAYKGFLLLDAQTQGNVIVDCRTTLMRFQPGSARIIFRGFKFDGLVDVQGTDIYFWHCDFTWTTDRSLIQSWTNSLYNAPRAMHTIGSTRTKILGGTFHDCATAVNASNSTAGSKALEMHGMYVHDVYPSRNDDKWHSDCVADNFGPSQITCTDFTFTPEFNAGTSGTAGTKTGGGIHQEGHSGPSSNLWSNGWIAGSANVAVENTGAVAHLDCTLDNIYHWTNNAVPDISTSGDVTLVQTNMHASAPASPNVGTNDPAALWKAANPYSSWLTYFSLATPPQQTIRQTLMGAACDLFGVWTRAQEQAQFTKAANFGNCIRIDGSLTSMDGSSGTFGDGVSTLNHITDIINAGHRRVVIIIGPSLPYPSHSTASTFQSQCATAANQVAARLASLVTPGGSLKQASEVEVIWEFINEPNLNPQARDIVEYSFWLKQACAGIKGAHPTHKVISGGAGNGGFATNVPGWNTSTKTSATHPGASNISNMADDGSGNWLHTGLDWVLDGLDSTVTGAGFDWLGYTPHIDGIGFHFYMVNGGPFNLNGATAGVNLTSGSVQNGNGTPLVFYCTIRGLNRIELALDNLGDTTTGIYCTETAGGTDPSYNSAKTYENNYVVFNGQGSSSGGGLTWTRPTAYKSTVNNNATTFPSGSWSASGLPTVNGGEEYGTENEMGQNLANTIKVLTGQIADVDGHTLTRIKLLCLFRIYDDPTGMSPLNEHGNGLTYGSFWNYGVLYKDGSEKGSVKGVGGTGPYAKTVAAASIADPRLDTSSAHANPTCTITSPTVNQILTTGGPSLTITWTYAQTDGDTQVAYMVQIFNKAGTNIYTSGTPGLPWQVSSAKFHTFDLVASTGNLFADTSNQELKAIVTVISSAGLTYQGASPPVVFDVQWGIPAAMIVNPTQGQALTNPDVTLQWTYRDSRTKAQKQARVQIFNNKTNVSLADSGWFNT